MNDSPSNSSPSSSSNNNNNNTPPIELSSKIKAMKFMKRKEEASNKKIHEEEQKKQAEHGHWRLSPQTIQSTINKPKIKIEHDTIQTNSSLVMGRQSYKNFNPEIQSMMKKHPSSSLSPPSPHPMHKSNDPRQINDSEMANVLSPK
jgi:hypothetical protein